MLAADLHLGSREPFYCFSVLVLRPPPKSEVRSVGLVAVAALRSAVRTEEEQEPSN